MAFWGRNFIFDGVSSENYSLIISSNDGEESATQGSNTLELITEQIFRRHKPYLYGVQQNEVLQLSLSVRTTEDEITAEDASIIQKWLFGKLNYKKLQIVQEDMEDYYFNCIITDPQIVRVGNIIRGFDFTAICDSPFATGFPVSLSYTGTSLFTNNTKRIYNLSENNYYTYPTITFNFKASEEVPVGQTAVGISITNQSDNNRVFTFKSWTSNDVVVFNNDLQIITSSLNMPNILSNFNKNFFRLVPGYNTLVFSGEYGVDHLNSVTIAYSPMKRIS